MRYVVAANYDSLPRTGTMTVAGQTFTVQQAGATTSCAPTPSGLVAWWRGEGNATDQTGNNNGLLVTTKFTAGKVGGGFLGEFQNGGGTYVEAPDSSSLTLTKSMSIEGWVKLNSWNGYVLRRANNAPPFLSSYSVSVFGPLTFTVFNENQAASVSSDPLPLGQFVHFAATIDDSTGRMSMYVNGNLVRQFTTTVRANAAAGATTRIGNIDGITDELSVYNRALSASEILAIYNAGTASTGAAGKCLIATALPLQLLVDPTPASNNHAIALDSVLFTRDPFFLINPANLFNTGADKNTRVSIFIRNLQLAPGELPSAVVVDLFDPIAGQFHHIPAENVWAGMNADFSQVSFRLPDTISPDLINVTVKYHDQFSNTGRFRINSN